MDISKKTVIIGASINSSRYAYMAAQRLHEAGHEIKPVSIKSGEVFGEPFLDLRIKPHVENVDTVTLYVGSTNLTQWQDYILSLNPKRIIFNPGTENEEVADAARKLNVEVVYGCTLVMLSTGQY
ncbi:MAG: CoA-binding protein [Reichenbachiella sp.]